MGAGPWFEWHVDEIVAPPGAEILARNASGVQAWRLGDHVGLQFHPEVDEEIVAPLDGPQHRSAGAGAPGRAPRRPPSSCPSCASGRSRCSTR